MYIRDLETTNICPYYSGMGAESDEARKQFEADFELLTPPLKDLLTSEKTSNAIAEISEHYNLTVVQTELVSWVIRNVVVGLRNIKNLPSMLSTVAEINSESSTEIANRIVSQLFSPLMEDLKRVQSQKFPDKVETTNQPPIATPPQPPVPQKPPALLPLSPSFHEQNMASPQKDIMETGGNVLDLRNQ